MYKYFCVLNTECLNKKPITLQPYYQDMTILKVFIFLNNKLVIIRQLL